jgi:CelD/BcsL family acetyltransferase involved in cellulose biosynthesis
VVAWQMKLTPNAFEAIYQACEPVERKSFFKRLKAVEQVGAVVFVEPPAPKLEVLLTGQPLSRVKLMAVADGFWDALQ